MKKLCGVVNYGVAGNLRSIKQAIEAAGGVARVIDSDSDFASVDRIVVPGVGNFKAAMIELEARGFTQRIKKCTENMPVLGICLGMQILTETSFEYGETNGLGIISGEVRLLPVDSVVPHMGFREIRVVSDNPILAELDGEEFYFMHSYEVLNSTSVSSRTEYAGHQFVSSIQMGHVFGVQFHPEKSREQGIQLFRNFLSL